MPQQLQTQRPDPEDAGFAASPYVFWCMRGVETLCALFFTGALPLWMPMTWLVLVAGSGVLRDVLIKHPRFRALPLERRRWHYRWTIWLRNLFCGSAAYFLYVPGDFTMLILLGACLLCSAMLVTLRCAGDFVRVVGAVGLMLAPTGFRLIAQSLQPWNMLIFLFGVGDLAMIFGISLMSRLQERAIQEQYELRQRAERASDAVASVGLAKSRFFSAVSHDLRQPVHAIGLYLDPLLKVSHATQDADALRAAEGIRQCWRALDGLLSQVLDLTRMDSGALQADMQSVELAPLVRDLVMQHSATAERAGVRLVALVQAGRFAAADELMLKRVLSNLIDNAIKFSPPGRPVVVALRAAGTGWQLQVRDAGIGIALGAQEKIFEEFVQLNNEARDRKRGLGLGLAISKRFAVLMGGKISVRSAVGCGCTMTIILQSAQPFEPHRSQGFQATAQPTPIDAILDAPSSIWDAVVPILPPQDILLIEDDPLVANAMCQLLDSWGLQVRHANSAADAALQIAFGHIAICDVRLPDGESGIDVALRMRAHGKKVLLITGETDLVVRTAAQTHHMQLLIKPVSSAKLLAALHSL